ncbi:hypothetical protein IW256_003902 [Actinomadura viridis]|uniref:Uncharacterized protein n=1 Tax=Actinomadura viridis TaxID=58110 RepID=A0A931DET7_9ACTN|nr:hypothetical protein [Actinomadura viridis]
MAEAPPRRRNPLTAPIVLVVLAVVISAATALAFTR